MDMTSIGPTTAGAETFLISVGSDEHYFDTEVTNGKIYYYKVEPLVNTLVGGMSPEASATPSTGPAPAAPTGLVATPDSYGSRSTYRLRTRHRY